LGSQIYDLRQFGKLFYVCIVANSIAYSKFSLKLIKHLQLVLFIVFLSFVYDILKKFNIIEDADGVGKVDNLFCRGMMTFYIKVFIKIKDE